MARSAAAASLCHEDKPAQVARPARVRAAREAPAARSRARLRLLRTATKTTPLARSAGMRVAAEAAATRIPASLR